MKLALAPQYLNVARPLPVALISRAEVLLVLGKHALMVVEGLSLVSKLARGTCLLGLALPIPPVLLPPAPAKPAPTAVMEWFQAPLTVLLSGTKVRGTVLLHHCSEEATVLLLTISVSVGSVSQLSLSLALSSSKLLMSS